MVVETIIADMLEDLWVDLSEAVWVALVAEVAEVAEVVVLTMVVLMEVAVVVTLTLGAMMLVLFDQTHSILHYFAAFLFFRYSR